MNQGDMVRVTTIDGMEGTISRGWISESNGSSEVPFRLHDGRTVMVPAERLERRGTGEYVLNLNLRGMLDGSPSTVETSGREISGETMVFPVVVEEPVVEKQTVETGRVRVTRAVHERTETIEEPLMREEFEVRRVPVNQTVDEAPKPRTEGDTLILPVMEEVLVVEKRLMLKEELHIIRHRREEVVRQDVTLRTQEPIIERFDRDGRQVDGTDTTPRDHNDGYAQIPGSKR